MLRKGVALYLWNTGKYAEVHVPAVSELVLLVHLSGAHRVRMLGEQGPSTTVSKPGDITIIPSGQELHLLTGGELEFATLLFPADAPPPQEQEPWFRLLSLSSCIFARQDGFATANIHALIDAIQSPPRDGLKYFNQMYDSLVFHLARIVDEMPENSLDSFAPTKLPAKPHPLDRLLDHIEENLAEKLSLGELANIAGVGRSLLAREFRQQFGCAPHQFIVQRRIERAKVLLESGLRVTDIAFELGFSSQSHFSTTFKAVTGCAPRNFARS